MTNSKTADYPHTAITTWSGFIYQGKVAIYHVLQLLKNQGAASKQVLQLDSIEDFAILNENGSVLSVHQVKALKSTYYSAYQEAFEQLKNKARDRGCSDAYFHVAQEIIGKTLRDIETTHSPVKLYCYGPRHSCALSDIDNKIEERIRHLYATHFSFDGFRQSSDYHRKVRGYLDQIVLKEVLKIHSMVHEDLMSDRQAAHTEVIPFSKFWAILERDLNQEHIGEDYFFYVLLGDLCRYYQEFCIENEIVDKAASLKLSDCMKKINGLSKEAMISFIRNIMPHRTFKFDTLSDYKDNTLDKDEVHDAFLRMLHELKQPEFDINKYFRWNSGGTTFTPTTIDKSRSHTLKVCERIIKNALDTDLDVMFESSSLITSDIDVESIAGCIPEEANTPEYDARKAELITRWKTVSLVSLDNAKEKINA